MSEFVVWICGAVIIGLLAGIGSFIGDRAFDRMVDARRRKPPGREESSI